MNEQGAVGEPAKLACYPETVAGGFSSVDGTVQFYNRVNALIGPDHTVVDLGAGRGSVSEDRCAYRRSLATLKGKCARVIGVDVDPVVLTNPLVDEARLIGADGRLPLEDGSVDLIVSDAVFEHIAEPRRFAEEIDRVLKPGGWVCARTPNRWGYVGVAANLVPNAFHNTVLRRVQTHRKEKDVFPTTYTLNTRRRIKRYFPPDRFKTVMLSWNGEPAYFGQFVPAWWVMKAVFWLLPPAFGAAWFIFIRKTG